MKKITEVTSSKRNTPTSASLSTSIDEFLVYQ